jgi:hypothetical protein
MQWVRLHDSNLGGRDISSDGDFLNVLFSDDRKSKYDSARKYIKEL